MEQGPGVSGEGQNPGRQRIKEPLQEYGRWLFVLVDHFRCVGLPGSSDVAGFPVLEVPAGERDGRGHQDDGK